MPTVYTASCAMCAKPFRSRRLNANAYCASCIRHERDIERGYGKEQCGDYTCVFCDATVHDTTHFTVVIEGELYPADYDCLLNNASEHPEAAEYVTNWLTALRADQAAEDAALRKHE